MNLKTALLYFVTVFSIPSVIRWDIAFAQTSATGQLAGTIRDKTGAVLPGVQITAVSGMGLRREALSGGTGDYALQLLPPGQYNLEFALSGFKTLVLEKVVVKVTETTIVNETLDVAAIAQTVNVIASPTLLQTANPTTGRVVEEKTIRDLPLATRNFTQLLALSPGANASVADNSAVGLNSQDVSVNGASRFNNNLQLNGVDSNTIGLNNVFNYPIPATDTLQEFKVQTSLYDASFGRNAGGQIQVLTKSGSNEFHGNAYHFFRNNTLNANNFFLNSTGTRRPLYIRNQFGFTLGGPVRKDRTFFFVSYQGSRERNGAAQGGNISAISSLSLPPGLTDDRSLAGISRASGVAIDQINPVAVALLNARLPEGSFVIPTPQVHAPGVNFTVSAPAKFREDQYNLNLDHAFSMKNTFSAKYFSSWNPVNQGINLAPPGFGANVPGFGGRLSNNNRHLSLSDTHIFSSKMINEARFGFNRVFSLFSPQEPVNARSVGISRFNDSLLPGIPLIGVLGSFRIGPSPIFELRVAVNTFTYGDTLSYSTGRHNMRFGVEFRRSQENAFVDFFQRGQLTFLNFADFVKGNIFLSLAGSGIFRRDFRNTDFDWFVQDDIRVTRKLTINAGLRYEYDGIASDKEGRTVIFDPSQFRQGAPPNGFVLAGNAKPQFRIPGVPLGSDTLVDRDLNNFAPRIGFAYQPFEKRNIVVRGGYGIFYQRVSNQGQFLSFAGPPLAEFSVLVFPTLFGIANFNNPFPALPLAGQFPVTPVVPGTADLLRGVPPISLTSLDPHLRTPYVQQFNVTLQWQAAKDFLFELGYVGTKGTKLLRQVRINQALLASSSQPINGITDSTPFNAALRAPFLGLSPNGLVQVQSSGSSIYHSLQFSVTKRLSKGLQFLASYTVSKSIDDAATMGPDGDASPVATGDQRRLSLNRGLSDFDRTHRFVFSGTYDLPAFRNGTGTIGKALSGWEIAGIATVQSGLPTDIVDSAGGLLFGVTTSRANFAPGATLSSAGEGGSVESRLNHFFNTGAFRPAGLFFGDVGRNILRGPNQRNIDFSVIKRTAIRERQNIEFRAEFLNLFNFVNFANPGSDIAAPQTFGVITNTSTGPRTIQFALKYNF